MKRLFEIVFLAAAFATVACSRTAAEKKSKKDGGSAEVKPAGKSAFVPARNGPLPSAFGAPKVRTSAGDSGICGVATTKEAAVVAAVTEIQHSTSLSRTFLDGCADCHGFAGEGRDKFPSLQGKLDAAAFTDVIRKGRNGMPAFSAAIVPDDVLNADFAVLKGARGPAKAEAGFHDVGLEDPSPIGDDEFRAVAGVGLKAWRNPGESGSCSGCHGPDGIDLARIGYSSAAILRRAIGQGRSSEEASAIVAMIRAQRRRYKITSPCSPTNFRPLQPTGRVLSGTDPAAVETELGAHLEAAGFALSTTKVKDAAAARAAADAVRKSDMNAIPIGIALNPWTADAIHGRKTRSTAEWIPELAVEPRSKDADERWTALQNAYLEDPSVENLWRLYEMTGELDASRFVDGGIAERLSREKYRAVLVLQHMMREDARTLPDLTGAKDFLKFSIWETGQVATVMLRGCGEDDTGSGTPYPCWNYLPNFFVKMGSDRDALLRDTDGMVLPWLTAGLIADPSLQFTENGDAQMLHLHDALDEATSATGGPLNVAGSLPLHHVYLGAARFFKSVDGQDPRFPTGHGFEHKTVNGCWNAMTSGLTQWKEATLRALTAAGIEDYAKRFKPKAQGERAYRAAMAVNRMALYLIAGGIKEPKQGCKDHLEPEKLRGAIKALGEWGAGAVSTAGETSNQALATDVLATIQ